MNTKVARESAEAEFTGGRDKPDHDDQKRAL